MTSVDLPPPDTPVMQVNRPSGIETSTFFRLLPRALTISSMRDFIGLRRLPGTANQHLAGEILRSGGRVGHHLGGRALRDDPAARGCPRPVRRHDVVRLQDRVLVMLDDDDGIAEITQA